MTTNPLIRPALAGIIAALSLTACTTAPVLAPTGAYTVAPSYSVKLDRNWSDLSQATFFKSSTAPKVRLLSIDGLQLNRLYISEGLTPDDPLIANPARPDTKTTPTLRGKSDMSLSEQMEFVSQSVAALDYHKVETRNPQPVTVGSVKGVRFELTASTPEGLHMHGLAQAAAKDGKSYYIVYLAPEEHYYAASLASVTAIMDSAKLP